MKKFNRVLSLILSVLLVSAFVSGCGNEAEQPKAENTAAGDLSGQTLKIGLISSLADSTGRLHQDVINLFIDKWNSEGTLDGAKAELVAYDYFNNNAADTEMAIKSVQKLINSDHVQVVVPGQLSNIIQSVGDLINENEVLGVGLGLSATWMQQGWDYMYRPALNNDFQVPSITSTMKQLNQKDIAIIYANSDNCLTFRDSLLAAVQTDGLNIVADEMIPDGNGTGITGQVTSVINSKPDAVFVTVMGGNFGTVIKQLRQSGYKGMIYIGQILMTSEVDSVGDEEVNGVIMCSPYVSYEKVEDCKDEYIRSCLQEFYDKYGYCPMDDQFYKMWDAMLMVENAVKAAHSIDPKEIKAVIPTLKLQGTAGTMDFTTGSNECYFGSRSWVYTVGGSPISLEEWQKSEEAKKVVITNQQ